MLYTRGCEDAGALFAAGSRPERGRFDVIRAFCQWLFFLLLGVAWVGIGYGQQQVTIPDTPAGHALQGWLDSFNSGERAKMEAFIKATDFKQMSIDGEESFRNQTGGFDLLSIESSEPLLIKFRVKEKASPTTAYGSLQVKDAQAGTIVSFNLRALAPGAVVDDIKLDAAIRQRVVDGIAEKLKKSYVYAEMADKMVEAVQAHQKHGDYDVVTDGSAFAELLTTHLRDVSHDKHLAVNYSVVKMPPQPEKPPPPTAEQKAQMQKQMGRMNCGFVKVEILPRNIGYVKFNGFMDPEICSPTVAAAMTFLEHADAIIYDLRENGGGNPKMVTVIASYLFDQRTHLNDLYSREDDKTTEYWTETPDGGAKLANKPAFVLTASRTFSGAEEFSYDLQTQKRATIVGEVTGGGAHPVRGFRVDDHFIIGVPYARAINPVTKKDWEGTGVQPDVAVKASEALETAEKLAADKIQKK